MKKRLVSGLKWTFLYTIITLALLEGLLWIMGYRPYSNEDYHVNAKPGNPYVADNKLGIRLNPGTFELTLNKHVKFEATHTEQGTRYIPGTVNDTFENVVFLGCSFTYGYGVNDNESFPALIQDERPEWNITNRAVVGYGTAQHLLQLRDLLKNDPPECVILCLSSVHFIRTVLSQEYRANLHIGYRRSSSDVDNRMSGARFPYFDNCKRKVKHVAWNSLYSELPGRYWLASANFLQGILERGREPDCNPVEVTACLIREMKERCSKLKIPFGVVCLDKSHQTVALKKQLPEVQWKNVGFSFKNKKYTHLPYDSHPNAAGHKKIARSVLPFIENLPGNERR